ncbi:MAG: hypothetical protein ACJAX5_002589 [Patiriisocius sp.]|jgi:hypothetical protein
MTEPVLLVEKQDHVLVLKLNRPKKKNALSSDLPWPSSTQLNTPRAMTLSGLSA